MKPSSTTSNNNTSWVSTLEKNLRKKSGGFGAPQKTKKDKNQSDAEFDMEVFEWKENEKTVFIRRIRIEDGNKKTYLLLTDQCKPSLKIKLKRPK